MLALGVVLFYFRSGYSIYWSEVIFLTQLQIFWS